MPEAAPWCLYLLECRNGAYYAGITNRLEARYAAHLAGTGAKYTRANPPVRVVASRAYPDRSAASRAAWASMAFLTCLRSERALIFMTAL